MVWILFSPSPFIKNCPTAPSSMAIVDRDIVGKNLWQSYVDTCNWINDAPRREFRLVINKETRVFNDEVLNSRENNPIIIIDGHKDMAIPNHDRIFFINIESVKAVEWIIKIVDVVYHFNNG